ncbi:uncharacterized protein [Rutidosis leptorrhynchoides]|uniref:uncharacterized protein n=1 Tax=Rutidosis leptorrhynchoides TaxID=125765 RepID=UPI003A993468
MALVLKKLVTRSSSAVVPYLRVPPNYPRSFSAVSSSFLGNKFHKLVGSMIMKWMLNNNNIPYTNCYAVKITSKGEECLKLDMDENQNVILIDGHLMSFFNIPGIEKTTETDKEVRVFLDLAMKDIDHNTMKAKLKKRDNALLINGYVQKDDIRKYYDARVELPLPPQEICESVKTEIKDGGLVVTIPKVAGQEGTSSKTTKLTN